MTHQAKNNHTLRLGTRGSRLARWQAEWVAGQLRERGHTIDLVEIATQGDADPSRAIEDFGSPGVFTNTIQQAVLAGAVDLAVHSLKDLPTDQVEGLSLAAIPRRESPADVLVLADKLRATATAGGGCGATGSVAESVLAVLPTAAVVGTSSLRRQAQLRHARPDLCTVDLRGNVDTRLKKLDAGEYDAIVLAEAGLRRLGLLDRLEHVLPIEIMLPAVGQGALGIECRSDDTRTREALGPLHDEVAHAAVTAERAWLEHLRGGCRAPVAALATVAPQGRLHLQAVVLTPDGASRLVAACSGELAQPVECGEQLAEDMIRQGAARIIASARNYP
ncbi:MAG: hydroxymethylbilane synthase [Pirellulales bacterium]|nr:hydroxymethylbilane synthase [Pirellulales bacterium]